MSNQSKLEMKMLRIDPIQAARFLNVRHPDQVPVIESKVRTYTDAIKRGEFEPGEPLMFDSQWRLINGQHRLLAVIAADIPVTFVCIFGYDSPTLFDKIDSPDAGRTNAQRLGPYGIEVDRGLFAAILRLEWSHQNYPWPPVNIHRKPTFAALKKILPTVKDEIELTIKSVPYSIVTCGSRSLLLFAHLVCARIDRPDADAFFQDVATLSNVDRMDPASQLNRKLVAAKQNPQKRISYRSKLGLTIKAWNMRRRGEVKMLVFREAGSRPEPFPVPE